MWLAMPAPACGGGCDPPLPTPLTGVTDVQYLTAIDLFIRNYVSTSPGSSGAVDKVEPIDNKIEQAMDLVKSHLLLAVREEVDVLKANISKLVDKISVLERENEVLKTNASPQVLAQLEATPSLAPSPPPPATSAAPAPVPALAPAPAAPGPATGPTGLAGPTGPAAPQPPPSGATPAP